MRHEDGTGTAFYDRTMYQAPRGDYHVFEDSGGSQWYAIPGTPAVERRPVYEDGRPVYDGDKLQTTTVETMRYKSTPSRHTQPQKAACDGAQATQSEETLICGQTHPSSGASARLFYQKRGDPLV